MRRILILRPEPGAGETAARATALGLSPVVAPLFTIRPVAWQPPDRAAFDAVMLSSASAARQAGDGLTSFLDLPCYAIGEATGAAARRAGFTDVRLGPSDGTALVEMMAQDGVASVFHPTGEHHRDLTHCRMRIADVPVYTAEAAGRLPADAEAALQAGALVLLHSPRAATLLAALLGEDRRSVKLAAISEAAARAAGPGWRSVSVAEAPRDEALLELAVKLCQTGGG